MDRKAIWRSDWLLGAIVALAVMALSGTDLLRSLEREAYDLGVRASGRVASDRIAVIAIDDTSIANIGRWPWPRDVHAALVDRLVAAGAKVIGYTVFFSEAQTDPALPYITRLRSLYGALPKHSQGALSEFGTLLQQAEQKLNTDRTLAMSLASAGNVILPVLFRIGIPLGRPDQLPLFIEKHAVHAEAGDGDNVPILADGIDVPVLNELAAAAYGVGHIDSLPDVDGTIRSEPLVISYFGKLFPALSLQIAAKSLNLNMADVTVRLGEGVSLGQLNIDTDPELQMYTYFYKDQDGRSAFSVDSFFDVYSDKIPAEKYRGKIVLIGSTAAGIGSAFATPISTSNASTMPAVLMNAHAVSSILQEDFFVAPAWGGWASAVAFLLIAAYLIAVLPRLSAAAAAAATIALLGSLLAIHFTLMTQQLVWIQLMGAAVLLLLGHLTLTTKRFLVTEQGKARSDHESAESNRMLGLAFQGQGQLDMAFDKFRKCPLDAQLMDNLYNLALDFERRRQFNKAEAVFKHMAGYDSKFRDLEQRLARVRAMADTVLLGTHAGTHPGTLALTGAGVEKPMLGRYQVERELGKGAMGVVYLGTDPKIGRVVAIKTLGLSQEFHGDELEEVKARFFREAETAGRLNHPNIVTIFDAGEDQELAYIAMEFLKGRDLTPHTKPESLMPLHTVLSIMARVADALDYAHKQNVVHRDIKPANIMYDVETDTVKVTDFGIARITDNSKTKTGLILGTPSYMSPEQLAGKKIDGQSDLYSLGVTLYQLSCGALPFDAESMAQLMYKIANEQAPDPASLNPALPDCVVAVLNRAMAKDKEDRYQSGEEMARAIRGCSTQFNTVDDSF
jgi:serine/threonine-protein kinase